jgi:hypothetical protein
MKKISLLFCSVLACTAIAYGQGSYVRLNVGYGMPMGSQFMGTNASYSYNGNTGDDTYTEKGVYGSYGSGISINAGYGMTLKGIIGFDVEVGYLMGKEYDGISYKDTYTETNYRETETFKQTRKTSGFSIAPAITLTAQDGKFLPYTRFGPVIGMYKMTSKWSADYYENDFGDVYSENYLKFEEEYTGGISVGFKGSVGVIFNPASKFQIFSEVNFVSMSFTPKKGEITKVISQGQDVTSDIPAEYKKFDFKDKLNSEPESEGPIQIGDRISEKHAMGSLSLQVGVRFKLN